jgi:hypothetical protein
MPARLPHRSATRPRSTLTSHRHSERRRSRPPAALSGAASGSPAGLHRHHERMYATIMAAEDYPNDAFVTVTLELPLHGRIMVRT